MNGKPTDTLTSAIHAQLHAAEVLAALLRDAPDHLPEACWTIYRHDFKHLDGLVEDRAELAEWARLLSAPVVEERGLDLILRGKVATVRDGVTVVVWAELDRPGGAT